MTGRRKHEDTLARVLGPGGPALGGPAGTPALARTVAPEAAGADADAAVPGLRAHLEGCPACREEHDSLLALLGEDSAQ